MTLFPGLSPGTKQTGNFFFFKTLPQSRNEPMGTKQADKLIIVLPQKP